MSIVTVKTTKDKSSQVLYALKQLGRDDVLVGIPAETSSRKDDPINNAELGYIHEFGVPSKNIPARPFLIPGVKTSLGKAISVLRDGARAASNGDQVAVPKALHSAGIIAQRSVRQKITDGPFAPLSERTTAARRAKHKYDKSVNGQSGWSEIKPLIDTGQLRQSITYVVRRKK